MRRFSASLVTLWILGIASVSAEESSSSSSSMSHSDGSNMVEESMLFRRLDELYLRDQPQTPRQTHGMDEDLPCDIECRNGGTCHYIPGEITDWKQSAQSKILIQICDCPAGFGGVGCEIPVEECLLESLTCELSGKPCDVLPDGTYTCACHVADNVDPGIAGHACRSWNTEYCAGQYDETADEVYLCTNSGKCQSDFIAAQLAPGDFAMNLEFADAGCVCGEHFYGPHCEFLNFEAHQNILVRERGRDGTLPDAGTQPDGSLSMDSLGGVAVGLLGGVLVGSLVLMLLRRRHRIQAWQASASVREGVFRDPDNHFSDTAADAAEEAVREEHTTAEPSIDGSPAQQELVDVHLDEEDTAVVDPEDPLEIPAGEKENVIEEGGHYFT